MGERAVAYVLKGWPRRSELFIASEVWRLERLGVPVRLYVLRPADEDERHPVVDRIAAVPAYLPETTSLSDTTLLPWLRRNLPAYAPSLRRMARRHPVRLARTAAVAFRQAVRARTGRWPRKLYAKEFLQAVELADRVEGEVAHLHAHFAHGTTTVTWLAALLCRLPFSFTGHAKDIYRESLNPAGLLPRKMRAAAFVVTCTGANREHLLALEPTAPVHLVHHGLNADFAALLTRSTSDGPPPDKARPAAVGRPGASADAPGTSRPRVAAVGRLVPKKGFDVLLRAVARLRDEGVEIDLTIAGEEGEESAPLRKLAAELGLGDRVRWAGPLSQAALLDLYRASDVFALACRVVADGDRDGIPNVMVEAMAAGLPVVSTAVSGIPELVRHDENGLLVPQEDPDALAAALGRLAADPALRHRLGDAGRVTVADRFDGDVLARRMAALFAAVGR